MVLLVLRGRDGGLGSLPDTILTRSVIIRMRKRAPNETCEPYRRRVHEKQGHALRDRLAKWSDTVREQVSEAWPEMPDGVTDRPADVWEPLLAVADAAGGDWPERARTACVELINAAHDNEEASLGIRLLTDLRDKVFCGADRMPTAVILECLLALDDSPWADLDDKPITSRTLAKMLGQYVTPANKPIKPRTFRMPSGTPKGYYADDLSDAWTRYCPSPPLRSATFKTSATPQVTGGESVADTPPASATRHRKPPHSRSTLPADQHQPRGAAAPTVAAPIRNKSATRNKPKPLTGHVAALRLLRIPGRGRAGDGVAVIGIAPSHRHPRGLK